MLQPNRTDHHAHTQTIKNTHTHTHTRKLQFTFDDHNIQLKRNHVDAAAKKRLLHAVNK